MKIFETIQKQYAILGIISSRLSSQKYRFNEREFLGFLLFGYQIFSQFVYVFHEASGFMEYVVSICATSGTIIMFVCFAAIVFRKSTLFESIDNVETLIDKSECHFSIIIYVKKSKNEKCILGSKYPRSKRFFLITSQRVNRLCEIFFMLVVKVTLQVLMLPTFVVSYGLYLFTDLGSESFQMPYPMW